MKSLILFFGVFYFLNAIYYFIGIFRLIAAKKHYKDITTDLPFLSIIIPARNEEKNLEACLSAIEKQDYRSDKWELWIINDQSTDETSRIAEEYAHKNNNFNVIHVAPGVEAVSRKKHAVQLGVGKSRGDIIVTTDADCVMGETWLKSLVSNFDADTGLVVGIPVYQFRQNSLELYQALDYASLSLISTSLVANKTPVMCSAANMAFRRETFVEVNGYEGIDHFVSGDDDLLLQKIHIQGKWKIKATISPSSFTFTKPVNSWRKVLDQRSRWGSKGAFYPLKWVRFYLAALFLTHLVFIIGWLFAPNSVFVGIWLMKFAIDLFMASLIIKILDDYRLFFGFFFVFIGQPFMTVFAAIRGFSGKYSWK